MKDEDTPRASTDEACVSNQQVIETRKGLKITLDDADGVEKLILETPGGQKIIMTDTPAAIEVRDAGGNSVKLEPGSLTVTAAATVTVNALAVEVSTSMLTVNTGIAKFSGMVQADTLICNSVISASYTPGAGNIW